MSNLDYFVFGFVAGFGTCFILVLLAINSLKELLDKVIKKAEIIK